MRKLFSFVAIGVLAGMSLAVPLTQRASAAPGSYYDWISRDYNGGELDTTGGGSGAGEVLHGVSSDGRFVLFTSLASDVVPNDTNGVSDLFMRDRQTDTTTMVSVNSAGQPGNDVSMGSGYAAISGDGRYVVFLSRASNLVPNDTNASDDVFLRDTQAGTTTRVCGNYARGCNSPAISRDGRYITYTFADPFTFGGVTHLYRYDRTTGESRLVTQNTQGYLADGFTPRGSYLSADGRYVVFNSYATNLVADDTNGRLDIFRRDMDTGEILRVSSEASGVQANGDSQWPAVSDDGRYVIFTSTATNFVPGDTGNWDLFVKDINQGTIQFVGGKANAAQTGTITGDGTQVVFETSVQMMTSDTNTARDIYSWNHATGVTTRYSDFLNGSAGVGYDAGLGGTSIDGRYTSLATYMPLNPAETQLIRDMYVHAIDAVRPTVTFTAPASFAGPFATGPTVTVTASDADSGLKSLVIHVYTSGNQLLNTCGTATPAELSAGSKSCDLSSLPAGSYYIKAGSFDNANNNRTINSGTFVIGS